MLRNMGLKEHLFYASTSYEELALPAQELILFYSNSECRALMMCSI
jgi:hypothetical protein